MFEPQMDEQSGSYKAFLVRLWQERPGAPWRASAQSVETGETVRFGQVHMLLAFLNAQAMKPAPGDRHQPATPPQR